MRLEYRPITGFEVKPVKADSKVAARCIEMLSPLATFDAAPCHEEAKTATECLQHILDFLTTGDDSPEPAVTD